MITATKNLLDVLLDLGYLTPADRMKVEGEMRARSELPETVILEKKLVDPKKLYAAKAKLFGVPFYDFEGRSIPAKLLQEVPEEAVRKYRMVPLAKSDQYFDFGFLNPDDLEAQEAVKFIAGRLSLEERISLISPADFQEVLKQYTNLREEVHHALRELETELKGKGRGVHPREVSEEEIERIVEEAPITKVVAVILRHAVEGKASDIHIEPTEKQVKVRFRVDGILYTSLFLPIAIHPAIVSRIKILSNLKIDETRIPQDGRFRTKINAREIDFRIATFPTTMGEKVAMRVLDPSLGLLDVKELGLEGRNLEVIEENIRKPFGMILLTGPTGSGKTTTLYSLLRVLTKDAVNIVSLEDPVEYHIDGVNQSQVRPEIGYNFAEGLRHVVRQDPDIIMVGEIRDPESASLATHAALTGHIVLSTLHTNNAIGIIPRLIDMGVDAYLIPSSLNVGVAQRLVRRLCDKCKKQVKAPPRILELIKRELETFPEAYHTELPSSKEISVYEAPGCKNCFNKGMVGRIGIFEVISMTPELEDIVIHEPSEANIIKEAKRQGMITLRQDGILKVVKGITTIEEVIKATE